MSTRPGPDDAFYQPLADGRFAATPWTRGPWSEHHQHGGPPSALLARAFEATAAELGLPALVRLTVELVRPVPIAPLAVRVRAVGQGRTVRRLEGTLCADEVEVVRAVALVAAPAAVTPAVPTVRAALPPPPPDEGAPFPFFRGPVGYHTAMDLRFAAGGVGHARSIAWLRMRVALVAGEPPTPVQRVLVAADSGNGVTAALDTAAWSFVNPDLTVYLQRPPRGAWIGLDAEMRVEGGLGLADTALHDQDGVIGRGVQSLLIRAG